jgi:apolipoprotein N-acyltransferase
MGTAAAVVAVVGWGSARVARGDWLEGEPLRVGLVQGNVAQEQKYDPRFRDGIIGQYLALSRDVIGKGARLVVWPEAATPFYFDAEGVLARPVRELAAASRTPFLLGTDEYAPPAPGRDEQFFNSAVLVGDDGRSRGSYKKMRLVPFGEFVPFKSILFFVGPLVEAVSDFSAGTEPVVFDTGRGRVSVAICYESVYPSVSRAFVNNGSQLLATITNDAWFGRSSAPYQHFQQGAIRAVEQGRYVVRAANTGISGAVDPYGRVLAASQLFEPAAVTVDVRLVSRRTIYGRVGDIVVWLSILVTLALVWQSRTAGVRRRLLA